MKDEEWGDLKRCEEVTGGDSQCTDPNIPCFELEEGENPTLCTHCWVQNWKGRCELNKK